MSYEFYKTLIINYLWISKAAIIYIGLLNLTRVLYVFTLQKIIRRCVVFMHRFAV